MPKHRAKKFLKELNKPYDYRDNNNEYINPTITTTTSKITKLFIVLFVNDKILFGKKFLNIEIYYI